MKNTRQYQSIDHNVRAYSGNADFSFIYTVSATKDTRWNVGDNVKLPDGREFVYAKSSGACYAGQGCEFVYTGYQSITALGAATAVGSNQVTVAAGTHSAVAEDELAGGYIIIYPSGSTNNTVQFRGIIGNDASAANAATTVYLDANLILAVGTADTAEIFANPFASVRLSTSTTLAKAGVAATYVSATGKYFWIQTKGFCWLAPQSGVGARGGMGCFWRHDGSLESADTALAVTTATNDTSQYAGFCVTGSAAGNGPLFKLVS